MNSKDFRNDEGGWALVTAVAMMSIMLIIGLATMSTVDFNSKQTREQRELESSLNLTEGVLYAQAFALAKQWPAAAKATAFPAKCDAAATYDSTSAAFQQCPNKEYLSAANSSNPAAAAFNGVDFKANGTWTTRVRDNYGQLLNSYNVAAADLQLVQNGVPCPLTPCTKDFNGDRTMWVESRSVVRGKVRKVVAQMRLEQVAESVPITGITAGALAMANNGAASYDVTGSSAIVRCDPADQDCVNFGKSDQTNPHPREADVPNFMNPAQINRFRERAITDGTHFASCYDVAGATSNPPPNLAGAVVFFDHCDYDSGGAPGRTFSLGGNSCTPPPAAPPSKKTLAPSCTNSITAPGIVIVACGGIRLAGSTYVGVVYLANGSGGHCPNGGLIRGNANNPSCPKNAAKGSSVVIDIQAGAGVWGAIAADGGGCIQLGNNGMQVKFDPRSFGGVASYGTVGLVQNTWRELPPGTN